MQRWTMVAAARALVLAAAAVLLPAAPAAAEIATVKQVKGSVQLVRGKAALAATPGTRLETGDVLATGKDGRIGVTFIDDTRFSVGPNSRVRLSRYDFDDVTHLGTFEAKVEKGTLAVVSGQIAKENPKGMTVQTPTSVLGVRGTRFVVTVK